MQIIPITPVGEAWLRRMSYSSRLTLHSCPRKFMLNKLLPSTFTESDIVDFGSEFAIATANTDALQEDRKSATFAYGHAVGGGIQKWLETRDTDEALMAAFMLWDTYLWDESDAAKGKTFENVINAVLAFPHIDEIVFSMDEWEIFTYNGRPATELSYRVHLPGGFVDRGFVDVVLQNKFTGELMVLECKTTGSKYVKAAAYQNSDQGVGYAVVLDKLAGRRASYRVLYTVYLTTLQKWVAFSFPKTPADRYQWFENVYTDTSQLQGYVQNGFPTRGEHCMTFNRECHYLGQCKMDLSAFVHSDEALQDLIDKDASKPVDIEITLDELLAAQMG